MKNEQKIQKLEKMGYKVSYMSGNRNGELSIIGVVAIKNGRRYEKSSISALYKYLK